MGCTNTKVGPEPTESCGQAWTETKRRRGWRRMIGRIMVPTCGGSTKVEPIGVIREQCKMAERTDFKKPANGPLQFSDEDIPATTDTDSSALNGDAEKVGTLDQSRPGTALPCKDIEVMGVVDLEAEPAKLNPIQYFASRSSSPLPARLPVKRAWRERPPSRGGIQLELALYGKNTTRPFPSCLSRAVLKNNFQDNKLKNDVRRAQKLHLDTQLDSVCSHDGKARAKPRTPSVAQSCLDAFMEHERKGPLTKFGRKMHRVCISPVEEKTEPQPESKARCSTADNSPYNQRPDSACRVEFDFYF